MNFKDILVIKVGTSTLTRLDENGIRVVDSDSFQRIGRQIQELHKDGHGIIVVSSAAISGGMAAVGMTMRPDKSTAMPELQRLASIGWRHILNTWADVLPSLVVGELLLTKREVETTEREGDELMRVMHALLCHGDIAIANENDAISHSEIAFGDNDTLAASIAARLSGSPLFDCDVRLLLLSDVNGVYQDLSDSSSLISAIHTIDEYQHIAAGARSLTGTGGMETKFIAARIATTANVETWVGNGRQDDVIGQMLVRKAGTYFAPHESR